MSERDVLESLRENARYSTADIARMTDLEESEVEAVIEELEAAGVVRGYQAVVDWDKLEDERVRAEVELNVRLDRETGYGDIAERLVQFRRSPRCGWSAATTTSTWRSKATPSARSRNLSARKSPRPRDHPDGHPLRDDLLQGKRDRTRRRRRRRSTLVLPDLRR